MKAKVDRPPPPVQNTVRFALPDAANSENISESEDRAPSQTPPCVYAGLASVMMFLFLGVSIAHYTVRYNSAETTTLPNFPDQLSVNLRAGGGVVSNSQLGSVAAGVQAPLVATDGSSSASSLLMAAPALSAATDADADVADMYIFTMTYQPEFCFEHHSSTYPGCMKPNANFTRQLTIHGLWPQFSSGGYPQYCGSDEEARLDLTVIARLAPRLAASWPDDKNTEPQNPLHTVEFYAHEWAKHGTCTNLTQLEYFTAALDTFYLPAPRDIIASHYGKTVSVPELQAAFEVLDPDAASQGPSVVLICEGHGSVQYLKEVRVCVGQRGLGGGAIGRPGQHVTCPPPVLDGMLHETCRDDRPIQLGQFRPRTPSSTLATLPLAATDAAPASSLVEGTEVLEADLAASTDKPTIITTTAPIDDNEHRADRVKPGSQNESLMM